MIDLHSDVISQFSLLYIFNCIFLILVENIVYLYQYWIEMHLF